MTPEEVREGLDECEKYNLAYVASKWINLKFQNGIRNIYCEPINIEWE